MKSKIFSSDIGRYYYKEQIFFIEMLPGVEVTLENAKKDVGVSRKIVGDDKYCVCIDLADIKSIDREAREYFRKRNSQEHSTNGQAIAIIVHSLLGRVIANFFIGFNKPEIPLKLFTKKEEAVEWLRSFL